MEFSLFLVLGNVGWNAFRAKRTKVDDNATTDNDNEEIIRYLFDNWNPITVYRAPPTLCCYKVQLKLKSTERNLMAQHQNKKFDHIHFGNWISFVNDRQRTEFPVMKYWTLNIQYSFIISHLFFSSLSFNWKQKNVKRILVLFSILFAVIVVNTFFKSESNRIKLEKNGARQELGNLTILILLLSLSFTVYRFGYTFYEYKKVVVDNLFEWAIEWNHTSLNDNQSYRGECMKMHLVDMHHKWI